MYGKERENNGRKLERRTGQRRKEEEEHKMRKIEKRVRFDRAEESGKIRRDVDWDYAMYSYTVSPREILR